MAAKNHLPAVPSTLADVALVDGPTAAAAASMCLSKWHDLVRLKKAPQPCIRAARCTRWRLADVRQFLIEYSEQGSDNQSSVALVSRALKASARAKAKRDLSKAVCAMAASAAGK